MTANGKTQSSGYAHAYHERVLNDVLRSSQGYEHKTRRDVGNGGSERSREIRERIAIPLFPPQELPPESEQTSP